VLAVTNDRDNALQLFETRSDLIADSPRMSASSLVGSARLGFPVLRGSAVPLSRLSLRAFLVAGVAGCRQVPVMAQSLWTLPFRWSWARWSPSNPGAGCG
jgi:hypothetical protein